MNEEIKAELLPSFENFIDKGWYILGDQVKQFEHDYANYCTTKYAVGVANGLDALIIALKTLNIGVGDQVIVPSNTYIASWLAVSYVGATPVPVEPRVETYNINPDLIEAAITPKTKAIMPVHLYGQCCEMDAIMNKLNALENKLEKYREKTPQEKLELRSYDSYPFNQKLSQFFDDKKDEMEKTGKNDYVLTPDDVTDINVSDIKDSFQGNGFKDDFQYK